MWLLSHSLCRTAAVTIVALLSIAVFSPVRAVERGPVGLDALDRLDLLPYLWAGREAFHTSSHDLDGGNDDRGNYLSSSGLTKVLFDAKGPGCIYRIWTTNQYSSSNYTPTAHGDIRIYIDGSPTPAVNTTLANFFSGNYSVFQSPLVGPASVSSGGFYCYLPIPYRTACRIEWIALDTTTPALYFNIDYHSYDSTDGITSFTGQEQNNPAYVARLSSVKAKWQSAGTDPKPAVIPRTFSGTRTIPKNGGRVALCDINGPGCISRLKLRCPTTGDSHSEWWNMIVRIYFDDHLSPDVQTSFGRFFGGEFYRPTDRDIIGLLFGTNRSTGWNYNYFPMPFATRARVELQSNDLWADQSVDYEVSVSDMPDAARLLTSGQIGHFKSTQNLNQVMSVAGQDYNLLDAAGRGTVVGYVYAPQTSDGSKSYLEGDERIHVDNCLTPAIYGTGTEDTFNAGWYFKYGEFSLPTHGFTAWYTPDGRALYRLLIGDAIPYNSRLKFGFEVGPNNDLNGVNTAAHMYSTVYYYASPAPVPLTLTDTLDVGSTTSEGAHSYSRSAASLLGPYTRSLRYEGDNDNVAVAENGRHFINGYSQFTLSIRPDNYGVKLRRLSYYYVANQQAAVYVDSQPVGTWYDAGSNTILSWRDSDFSIPASFTQGKSSIRVKIVSSGEWTEYKYRAFSYVSPSVPPPSPAVGDDGLYTSSTTSLRFSWTKPDEPVWGITAYSYAIGTTPGGTDVRGWTDAGTGLSLTADSLQVEPGRKYFVSVKAKNGAGVWSSPGTSDGILLPPAVNGVNEAKNLPAGTPVRVCGSIVTAVFGDGFYICDADRSSGIKVRSSAVVSEGDIVDVAGELALEAGERVIAEADVVRVP